MANKAYIYRLYPNDKQSRLIDQTIGCCRFVYNQSLAWRESAYNADKTSLSYDDTAYGLTKIKKLYPWLRDVDSISLQQSLRHLDTAYHNFFAVKKTGFPKYKSKHKCRLSYTTVVTGNNITIGDNFIKLPKVGKVKAVIHRNPNIDWKIKSATVTQNRDNTYQISILFEYTDKPVALRSVTKESSVGLDYKSDGLYADSNGNVCNMPHYYRLSAELLAKQQRKLRHKTIGSNNYRKQQLKAAKISRHVANQRKDFLHKQSTAIAKQYACVCVEDLDMKAISNKGFGNGKATLDNGYGMFLNMLDYKLKASGGYLVKVDKWFPSSQICNHCGTVHTEMKDLLIHTIKCDCGYIADRDTNAALNIKKEGLRLLSA